MYERQLKQSFWGPGHPLLLFLLFRRGGLIDTSMVFRFLNNSTSPQSRAFQPWRWHLFVTTGTCVQSGRYRGFFPRYQALRVEPRLNSHCHQENLFDKTLLRCVYSGNLPPLWDCNVPIVLALYSQLYFYVLCHWLVWLIGLKQSCVYPWLKWRKALIGH